MPFVQMSEITLFIWKIKAHWNRPVWVQWLLWHMLWANFKVVNSCSLRASKLVTKRKWRL